MRDDILTFADQLQQGVSAAQAIALTKSYARIFYCGMGGSSIAGDFLATLDPHVWVHNDYGLPPGVTTNDLVICVSWSGETQETISAYTAAHTLGADTLVITKGGTLGNHAHSDGTPTVILPAASTPARLSAGYMVGALWQSLGKATELPKTLETVTLETASKEIAQHITDQISVIYASYPLRKLAAAWKIVINENAQQHAFWNALPTMGHNEIMAYRSATPQTIFPIILQDTQETQEHTRDTQALLAILDEIGYTYKVIKLSGDTILTRLLNGYILGLWVSYYVATNLNIDPLNTDRIDEFKKLKGL